MDARGRAHHGQAADGVRRRALARDANPNPQSSSPLSRTLTLIRCAAEPSLMMLHTDVALVTDARFKPHVERFAKDQAAFFAAFAKASCLPPPLRPSPRTSRQVQLSAAEPLSIAPTRAGSPPRPRRFRRSARCFSAAFCHRRLRACRRTATPTCTRCEPAARAAGRESGRASA